MFEHCKLIFFFTGDSFWLVFWKEKKKRKENKNLRLGHLKCLWQRRGFFPLHSANLMLYFVPLAYAFIISCYFELTSHKLLLGGSAA